MDTIIEGRLINKEKRQEMFGDVAGGANSMTPEKYQRTKVMEITGIPCAKTNIRINLRKNTLQEISYPLMNPDGFDYSENFDGLQIINNNKVYINFKCVVGSGGSQTRSLREVYWFIQGQLNVLKENPQNLYFANILDGDEAHCFMDKYKYLIDNPEYYSFKNHIYVGDLKSYFEWVSALTNATQ